MKKRRTLLTVVGTVGTVAIAGCNSDNIPTGSEPKLYSEDVENKLLLTEDDFPDGWEYSPEQSDGDATAYVNENEAKLVGVSAVVNNSVSKAEEEMSKIKESFRQPKSIDIASDAFWDIKSSFAHTHIRHLNAIGTVSAFELVGSQLKPRVSLSHKYAREMFSKWEAEYPSVTSG